MDTYMSLAMLSNPYLPFYSCRTLNNKCGKLFIYSHVVTIKCW